MNPNPTIESRPTAAQVATRSSASRVRLLYLAILGVGAALALVWAAIAHVTLVRALDTKAEVGASLAAGMFGEARRYERAMLEAECQLLANDPRLKSTLATPGIDEPTIVDILQDLQPATGAKILAALAPDARVQAVVGEPGLRGVDLTSWSVIKAASAAPRAVSGGWTLGGRVLNVGATAIRLDSRTVAYLVLGSEVDEKTVRRIEQLTGAIGGIVVGGKATMVGTNDDKVRAVLEQAAAGVEPGQSARVDVYAARVDEIGSQVPAVRSVWLQSTVIADPDFKLLDWLLWLAAIATLLFTALLGWQSRELQG